MSAHDEVEPSFVGIGNFTGTHTFPSPDGRHKVRLAFSRPRPQSLPLSGLAVRTAVGMLVAHGAWPGWFVWIVGWPVPDRYVEEAKREARAQGLLRGAI